MSKKKHYITGMKVLRRPGKADLILNLFDEVGTVHPIKNVYEFTGIENYGALKAMLSYIRHAKHIPKENRIDVRIKDEQCIRVN